MSEFRFEPSGNHNLGAPDWAAVATSAIEAGSGIAGQAIAAGGPHKKKKKKKKNDDKSGDDGGGLPIVPIAIGVVVLGGLAFAASRS